MSSAGTADGTAHPHTHPPTHLHPVHIDASADAVLLANQTQLGDAVEEAVVELQRDRRGGGGEGREEGLTSWWWAGPSGRQGRGRSRVPG